MRFDLYGGAGERHEQKIANLPGSDAKNRGANVKICPFASRNKALSEANTGIILRVSLCGNSEATELSTRIAGFAIATILGLASFAAPVWGSAKSDCESDTATPAARLTGCTKVINSGKYEGAGLAFFYIHRGNAYRSLGDFTRAIKDYDQTIALDPELAIAYNNRGIAQGNRVWDFT